MVFQASTYVGHFSSKINLKDNHKHCHVTISRWMDTWKYGPEIWWLSFSTMCSLNHKFYILSHFKSFGMKLYVKFTHLFEFQQGYQTPTLKVHWEKWMFFSKKIITHCFHNQVSIDKMKNMFFPMWISNKMGIGKTFKNHKSEPLIHASILELVGLDH